ncbi:hypothetical protein KGF54_003741 [Candida jiufengensis]|uniref:uncharacterized protein n=1 Tax=Candida jiufengensis TaxID=497108 RepID=UPI002224C871|nr:uncharacterized protein KGF54_003741 [Candida jiufengensis]KAI5952874.1 hypothetical protein KGF54_003741 [Candida jiufengensis]
MMDFIKLSKKLPFRIRNLKLNYVQSRFSSISTKLKDFESETMYKDAVKRTNRRIHEYENLIELSNQYEKHRTNMIDILSNKDNINAIFGNEKFNTYLNYDEVFKSKENEGLTFNEVETRNTMMLISSLLLENVLQEIKLRKDKNNDMNSRDLIDELKHSDEFVSLEQYRKYFNYYKSSQFLNENRTDRTIKKPQVVTFKSNKYDNSELLNSLNSIFKKCQSSKDKLAHITLALKLVQTFLSSHTTIPTLQTFAFLLDKFGDMNLLNYQKIIYLSLFQYKHQPTLLATPKSDSGNRFPQLMPDHFLHLIIAYPRILESLLKYQVLRQDKFMFIELLSFLKLDKLAGEIMVIKSPLLSKSKYKLPNYIPTFNFDNKLLLTVPRSTIYEIMKLTIDLEIYEYLDLLFNKIVLHSKDESNIELNYIEASLVEGKIFDTELFLIMLNAAISSNDPGRVMWILPFFDEFVKDNKYKIDEELKSKMLNALKLFGLEGKLKTYENSLE